MTLLHIWGPINIEAYGLCMAVAVLTFVYLVLNDSRRQALITKDQFMNAITGGTVSGPRLSGEVLNGGGDWQVIEPDGLTRVEAHYFLKASDGTVIEVTNPGVRVADPQVIEKLARGEDVDPSAYYFRTTPSFKVAAGPHGWLRRSAFIARGVRRPDHVLIDFYEVK